MIRSQAFCQVMSARYGQTGGRFRAAGLCQTHSIGKWHGLILLTMHKQNGARECRCAAQRRDVIKASPNHFLDMRQDPTPRPSHWNAHLRQPALHHLSRMREGTQADDRTHIGLARGRQQHRTRAHGMTDQGQARGIDFRLLT